MYLEAVTDLEVLLAAYLNVIFVKPKKTHDSLNILTRFKTLHIYKNINDLIFNLINKHL